MKRGDHLWKPLGYILLSFHWFNPVLWMSYIFLCRDIEAACDEKVVDGMDKESLVEYTRAMVVCASRRRIITACPIAFGETNVKGRVKNILNYKKPAFWVIFIAIAACVAVAACFLTNPKKVDTEASAIETEGRSEISAEEGPLSPYQAAETVPFSPDEIHDVIRAEVHENYGDFAIVEADEEKLKWLENTLQDAKEVSPTGCPFGTVIYIYREDGTIGTIEPAEDGCKIYRSGEKYYELNVDSTEIFNAFGIEIKITQSR